MEIMKKGIPNKAKNRFVAALEMVLEPERLISTLGLKLMSSRIVTPFKTW